MSNVWGHLNLFARGAGQAVAQLDVNYGVDYEPFKVRIRGISHLCDVTDMLSQPVLFYRQVGPSSFQVDGSYR